MSQQSAHFDKFTERAKTALVIAQREAQRRGQALIEPEHLLLGMLDASLDTACWVISELGVVPEMVCAALKAHLPALLDSPANAEADTMTLTDEQIVVNTVLPAAEGEQVVVENVNTPVLSDIETAVEPRLSSRTKQVITFAVAEFTALRHPLLATGHFLLGILREEQGSAFFSAWGIDLKAARAQMKRVTRQALLAEQQSSLLSAPVEVVNGVSAPSPGSSIGAVKINLARQQRIMKHRRSVRKVMWIYYIAFALVAFAAIAFILQSSQILSAYHVVVAQLAVTPGLDWQPVMGWQPLLVLLYYLAINAGLMIIALPLHWYISTVVPNRNGFKKRTTRQWFRMLVNRSFFLVSLATWLLAELVTWLMVIQPRSWWAWAALAPTLFFVVMGFFGSSRFAFWAKSITRLNEGEVFTRFQALRQRLDLPECGLYQFQVSHRTQTANAFFAGWGRGRRVVVTDTMLQQFPPDEIEVIMAHELGHCAHHDIWTSFVMSGLICMGLFGLIALYLSTLTILMTTYSFVALLQPLYLLLGIIAFFVLLRLNLLYRRYKEYQADEYALRATNNIQAFKDGMTRLTNMSMPRWRIRRSVVSTHPTLVKRLRHADEFAQRQHSANAPLNLK